jgi:hypothetical protein
MPKTPQDFSKGLIYSIVCKTDETLLYVGSTTNFTQRKNLHKKSCIDETHRCHNYPVYVIIRANGGWDNFDMKPVKEFPCESKIQLVIEEEKNRKEMKANLNTNKAYISPEELTQEKKEWHNQNYKRNKKQIIEKNKIYNKKNKEHLSEYYKNYREKTKEKTKEYHKQHYEKNKQQIQERRKIKKEERKNAL